MSLGLKYVVCLLKKMEFHLESGLKINLNFYFLSNIFVNAFFQFHSREEVIEFVSTADK